MDDSPEFPPECLAPAQLADFLEGSIDEPQLSEFTAHLEQCATCQRVARTLPVDDTIVETLRSHASEEELAARVIPAYWIEHVKQIPQLESRLGLQGSKASGGEILHDTEDVVRLLDPPENAGDLGQLGRYRVREVIGRGGMGAVFLAEDSKLNRPTALKVMLPRIASIPAARERFLREAKAAASLKNDHIVTIYQVDEMGGVPFLAMEWLQGESLEQSLLAGRRFSLTETLRIARDVATGLAAAHEKGLVHRDIKPANLWLEQTVDGTLRVKILDFGLARTQVDESHITEFGTIVGTPAFMAPEQARADRAVDARADLFSLGCVLYLLCTGEVPFKADTTVATLMALVMNEPISPGKRNASVPIELSSLVMQLLEKDPAVRPASAREVIDRLRHLEQRTSTTTTLAGTAGETLLGLSQPIDALDLAPALQPDPVRKRVARGWRIATGLLFAAVASIAASVLLWQTPEGSIVRIESNDPSIQLAFDNGQLNVIGAYDQPFTLRAGKVDLRISKPQPGGEPFEFETDKLVIKKGDLVTLKIELLDDEVRIIREGVGIVDAKPLFESSDQYERLLTAMRAANPGFDGAMVPRFERGRLVSLEFKPDYVHDISPLSMLKHLRSLRIGDPSVGNGISDLTPLQGLPLKTLHILNNPRVTDLSPLKGMSLQELIVDGCPIADFSPLAGMPISILMAWSWSGSDLSPLNGMPLKELNIGGNGKAMDLTPLAGAPLEWLCLNISKVSDLSPLKGMPLRILTCENTLVSDLSPIRDAKLFEFAGDTSQIEDISVLEGMPITAFYCNYIGKRELDLLRGCKTLKSINYQPAANVLREFSEDLGPRHVSPAFTNSVGMEFIQVPKGRAWLARKVGEEEMSAGNETVFEQDFLLGVYEVTQQDWVQVMGSNPSWFTRDADGADAVKILPDDILKRLPVERVSWTDCQLFLKKLNELDSTPGWTYRLPTEAEWQYACRGGSMNDAAEASFEFCIRDRTNELTPDDTNSQHQSGWNRPCRVGLFPPNPLGLYDMHGNVWEWCDDAAPWRVDPSRFIHGGGWNDPAADCRASHIKQPTEPWVYYDLGFRVARVPVDE